MVRCPIGSTAGCNLLRSTTITLCVLAGAPHRIYDYPAFGYGRRHPRPRQRTSSKTLSRKSQERKAREVWQQLKQLRASSADAIDFQKQAELLRDPLKIRLTIEAIEGTCQIAGNALNRLNGALIELNEPSKCAVLLVAAETGKAFRNEFLQRLRDAGISQRDISAVEENDSLLESCPGVARLISEIRGGTTASDDKSSANKSGSSEAERIAAKVFASARKAVEKDMSSSGEVENPMLRSAGQQHAQFMAELTATARQLVPEYNALTDILGLQAQKENDVMMSPVGGFGGASTGFGTLFGPTNGGGMMGAMVSDEVKMMAGIAGHRAAGGMMTAGAFGMTASSGQTGFSSIQSRKVAASSLLTGLLSITRKAYAVLDEDWSLLKTSGTINGRVFLDPASARWIRDSIVQSIARCYVGNEKASNAFSIIAGDAAGEVLKCAVEEKELPRLDYAHLRRVRDAWLLQNSSNASNGREQLEAFFRKSPKTIGSAKTLKTVSEFISKPEKRERVELDEETNELVTRVDDNGVDDNDEASPVMPVASKPDH